ncbi:homoprotocatechuate degradation operon regulator, HpaR [Slackia heliotrinireducens]|uniref:MarR family regulator n=1 Tax=Slackia heliotrinireducens (strain ATCC 29202 / DSM 20476 / NCTC 11029 / RHS 1) TaxID=471855 RepID=C7N7R9_SLAHD|nr:MarR family winged helix-turn-helix transcriptional regulator [Slackia heliotrinireducens]ACV22954.1 MarR family regulator [Slackia heliotrinireducens DSM 20476]VEH01801.1 homoprotocatechuate degradation operon regulator, HpaR [Slackia heliotrinireducens]
MPSPSRAELLKRLQTIYTDQNDLDTIISAGDLDFDTLALLVVLQKSERNTAGGIADQLSWTPSKTSRCLKKATARALIRESVDSKDLRKCHFKLSNKGANVVFEVSREFGAERLADLVTTTTSLRRSGHEAESEMSVSLSETSLRTVLLLFAHGAASVGAVSDMAKLSQPRISMALKSMQNQNLVDVGTQQADQRIRMLRLTRHGSKLARVILTRSGFSLG